MDLIQAAKILKKKERERDQLLGQKNMLINDLKEMGFSNIKEAEKELEEKNKELKKMQSSYKKGEERFISKFKDLLE